MIRPAILILSCLSLGGCASSGAVTADPTPLCATAWKQINVQPADRLTEPTARAIEGNNAAREAVGCKYEPPPRTAPKVAVASKKT